MSIKLLILLALLFETVHAGCRFDSRLINIKCCGSNFGRLKNKSPEDLGQFCCIEGDEAVNEIQDLELFCREFVTTTNRNSSIFTTSATTPLSTTPLEPTEPTEPTELTEPTDPTSDTTPSDDDITSTEIPTSSTTLAPKEPVTTSGPKNSTTPVSKAPKTKSNHSIINTLLYAIGAILLIILVGFCIWFFCCPSSKQRQMTVDQSGRNAIPPAGTIDNSSDYAFVNPRDPETVLTSSRSAERQQLLKQIHKLQVEKAQLEHKEPVSQSKRPSRATVSSLPPSLQAQRTPPMSLSPVNNAESRQRQNLIDPSVLQAISPKASPQAKTTVISLKTKKLKKKNPNQTTSPKAKEAKKQEPSSTSEKRKS